MADKKQNCWEAKGCGREPGGTKVTELGICPATQTGDYDGRNSGEFAGRSCWRITGTLCGGEAQGDRAAKLALCSKCKFFRQVKKEEKPNFVV